nr:MAG TPA: Presenilin [Caudoviricetes sp.]
MTKTIAEIICVTFLFGIFKYRCYSYIFGGDIHESFNR